MFKRILKNLIRKTGFEIISHRAQHALLRTELLLSSSLNERTDVCFIQIGAHDGNENDHLSGLRSKGEWNGTMVEANPTVFAKLKKNLSSAKGIKVLNAALCERHGPVRFYRVVDPSRTRFPEWADQISSLDAKQVAGQLQSWGHSKQESEELIEEIEVPGWTFDEVVRFSGLPRIDVLLLDTEGMDFQLLQRYPFDRSRPEWIVFECNHLTSEEMAEIPKFFFRLSYSYIRIGIDIVAKRWDANKQG